MSSGVISSAALAVSLAVHAWLIVTSSQGNVASRRPRPPAFVPLTVLAPEPEATPQPAPPSEPPTPKTTPKPVVPQPKPAVAMPEPPAPTPDTPPAPPPAELTGTTLVAASAQGDGWSAPQGTGNARDGLVRAGAVGSGAPRVVPAAGRATQTAPTPPLPEALPLSQLSRKPVPPSLAATLERNYPPAARNIGQSGDASVRARIEPNGRIRSASIVSQTSAGFGDACRRTLLASQWSAPLDRNGRPVATWISYRCKFRIDH